MSKKEYKHKPSMTMTKSGHKVMTKRGTKVKINAKGDTLYAGGTMQSMNKLTGEKSKKETMWMRKISKEEFDSGGTGINERAVPKVKLRKKSAGYKKVVRK